MGFVLHQLSPRLRQVARDGLPRRGIGGVGLLVVTSNGEFRKAPLLGTYGDDVTAKFNQKKIKCTLNSNLFFIFGRTRYKINYKPTATPPSTIIAASHNHSLHPFASLALVLSFPLGAGGGGEGTGAGHRRMRSGWP